MGTRSQTTIIQTPSGETYGHGSGSVVDSLFTPGPTHSGHYTRTPGAVVLWDAHGAAFAAVALRPNDPESAFVVTAHTVDGRTRYMRGLSELTAARLLGMPLEQVRADWDRSASRLRRWAVSVAACQAFLPAATA